MIFVIGETGQTSIKIYSDPETHVDWQRRELGTPAVGAERVTACAMRLLVNIIIFKNKRYGQPALTFSRLLYDILI